MDKAEIESRVKKVIGKVLNVNPDDISSDANFVFDLGADSTQSLELIAAFDEEFDIEMEEDQAMGVQDVSGAVDFIAKYVNQ